VSLVAGARMVRADDGMRGVVELVAMPGFEQYEELRIVYTDRGERRLAGKREVWEPEQAPPRKLREEEIALVALAADQQLRALDSHSAFRWWEMSASLVPHDPSLIRAVTEYLQKRG